VADEKHMSGLDRQSSLHHGGVIRKRGERKLNSHDVVAIGLQQRDYLGPARPVAPCSMNQQDIGNACRASSVDWNNSRATTQQHRSAYKSSD
jgi:hypothetical protein